MLTPKIDVGEFFTPALSSVETKLHETKRNATNTNTYLALTVPITLSSAARANDGSSTVTSNFGKTKQIVKFSHFGDPYFD